MATLLPGNILYGGPKNVSITTDYKSLGHYVMEKFKSFGNQTLMIDGASGQVYSAQFLYDSIVRLAHVLKYMGIQSNDVIGISSENSVEFAITTYASFAVNATVAPLNVTYLEREIHHAINISKPKLIFASKVTIDRITKVAKNNSFVKKVVVFGNSSTSSDVNTFQELMESKKIPSQSSYESVNSKKMEDVALILCSSGTTGLPKGVQLTQANVLLTIDPQLEPTSNSLVEIKILSVIPWFHSYGILTLITSASSGTCLVYLAKFEHHLFLSAIEKYRVAYAFMVPPLMIFLAKDPIVEKYDLSSLQVLFCGAAPLSKETEDQIKERIGVPFIRQAYGLSESTLGVLVQNDNACKPGSVGSLKVGLYAKVIDPDTGKTLGPHHRGELCFKGYCIMKGYIGDVKSTQNVIKDGWLHTGDIGYYDNDLEFFIVDRIKELIKYKGYQVPPAEIEALLLTNPKIKDTAVIGRPDEEAGELPMAFVVKQANALLSEQEVEEFVAERASSAKRLRGGIMFVDEIPKNPTGKILRRVLRDMITNNAKSKM